MRLSAVLLILSFFSLSQNTFAQEANVTGFVYDAATNKPIDLVTIAVLETSLGTTTNQQGTYSLKIPADKTVTIVFSVLGYQSQRQNVKLKPGETSRINMKLQPQTYTFGGEAIVTGSLDQNMIKIDPRVSKGLPSPTGNFEMILQAFGARTNNELSSQYSVRGGNFDENLVYVNDIEIYRPVLQRSGQQEGMSMINADLVESVQFSAGGFEAIYGDKLSSVLDVKYRKPQGRQGGFQTSFMGANAWYQDQLEDKRFSYSVGARYRTLASLLSSQDTKGEYRPTYADFQALINFEATTDWEFSLLAHVAGNKFLVTPQDRTTVFGTVREALQLSVFFDGREITQYQTTTIGATAKYAPNNKSFYKFIASTYQSTEQENFDIEGYYRLDALETDLGSDNFGKVAFNKGVGGYHNFARNTLNVSVYNLETRARYDHTNTYNTQWGVKFQTERLNDKLYEWGNIDSAAFLVPAFNDTVITFPIFIDATNQISSNRFSGFIQQGILFGEDNAFSITGGVRFNYWTFNNQLIISPRAQLLYTPIKGKDLSFRASIGQYAQPAFFREMRDFVGVINPDIRAQKSIHYVVGSQFGFKSWDRPFKFVSEFYYKDLRNIIPYEVENVRLRYYANDEARGYAAGLDLRINGEFVPGIESWASLSFMQTEEDIRGDFFVNENGEQVEIGYIPRPTDQRVNFAITFQDYLPSNPTYRVNLNIVYGSRLPFGPPGTGRASDTLRMPPYRRVDIGFSKQFVKLEKYKVTKNFKSMWLNAEVFNLLQVLNTISYTWVRDAEGRQYAVPNYLTRRQLNLRLIVEF